MSVRVFYSNKEVLSKDIKSRYGFKLYYGETVPGLTTSPKILVRVCIDVLVLFYSLEEFIRPLYYFIIPEIAVGYE
jgi:hypothetical protein